MWKLKSVFRASNAPTIDRKLKISLLEKGRVPDVLDTSFPVGFKLYDKLNVVSYPTI